jgi:hypothetical protein
MKRTAGNNMTKSDLKIHIIMVLALMFLGSACFGLIYLGNTMFPDYRPTYNCSLAEISPDFTPAMREECRRLRKTQQ